MESKINGLFKLLTRKGTGNAEEVTGVNMFVLGSH